MAVYRTCQNCIHRRTCDRKEAMRLAIKGLGITSLKFKCPERDTGFKPGDPVIVETMGCEPEDWEDEMWEDKFPGHFLAEKGTKALVYVPPGTLCATDRERGNTQCSMGEGFQPRNGTGFLKIPFARVDPDPNGEQIEVCIECGKRDPDCHRERWMCPWAAAQKPD